MHGMQAEPEKPQVVSWSPGSQVPARMHPRQHVPALQMPPGHVAPAANVHDAPMHWPHSPQSAHMPAPEPHAAAVLPGWQAPATSTQVMQQTPMAHTPAPALHGMPSVAPDPTQEAPSQLPHSPQVEQSTPPLPHAVSVAPL